MLFLLVGSLLATSFPALISPSPASETSPPLPASTVSPSPSPSPVPPARSIPAPRPTRVPPAQIHAWIEHYSAQYSVSPHVMRHIARCESGFNPSARTRLYGGLFQYSVPTWRAYRHRLRADPHPDLRFNAEEAIKTTAFVISQGGINNWPNCRP